MKPPMQTKKKKPKNRKQNRKISKKKKKKIEKKNIKQKSCEIEEIEAHGNYNSKLEQT